MAKTGEMGIPMLNYGAKSIGFGIGSIVGGKLIGKTISKVVSRVWPGHHPLPKYLGGTVDQTLTKMPRKLHMKFHTSLDK